MEFGIMFKGVDYWIKVTEYDFDPGQEQTYDQEGFEPEISVLNGTVEIDGAETESALAINRQLAESSDGMFDRLFTAKYSEINDRALEAKLEEKEAYQYERAEYLRDCKRDDPGFW